MVKQNSVYVLLFLFICLSGISQAGSLKKDRDLPNFDQVSDKLWRGGQPTAAGLEKLAQLGINTIISLRTGEENADNEKARAEALGLRWFNVPMGNMERPKDEEVERALALITDLNNGRVFIHCKRGADRTGAIVALYRITAQGWTAEQALAETKRFKMRWWQFSKRDYVRDYEKKQKNNAS